MESTRSKSMHTHTHLVEFTVVDRYEMVPNILRVPAGE